MASKESFATTEEIDESFGTKEQVIQLYMFEPNKGDRGEASDDSSEDSGSGEEEFDEEFEAAKGRFPLQPYRTKTYRISLFPSTRVELMVSTQKKILRYVTIRLKWKPALMLGVVTRFNGASAVNVR